MLGLVEKIRLVPLGIVFLRHLFEVRAKADRVLSSALKSHQSTHQAPLTASSSRDVGRLNRVVRYFGRKKLGTCLHRSLAAWTILESRGIKARVVIAPSAKTGEPFWAHAWVEVCSGQVVGEQIHDMPRFRSNRTILTR